MKRKVIASLIVALDCALDINASSHGFDFDRYAGLFLVHLRKFFQRAVDLNLTVDQTDLVDMSDEKWAADTDNAYTVEGEGVVGYPYTVEAIGLAYNKRQSRNPVSRTHIYRTQNSKSAGHMYRKPTMQDRNIGR